MKKEEEVLFAKKQKLIAEILELVDYKADDKKDAMRDIMDVVYKEMSKKLYEYTKAKAKPANLFEIDMNILKEFLEEEKESILGYDFLFDDSIRFVCAMHALLKEESNLTNFTTKLREVDSIYTHQFANYFDNILSIILPNIKSGEDVMKLIEKSYNENVGIKDYERSKIDLNFGMNSLEKIRKDLFSFHTILDISEMIKENNLCKVDFNETGEIVMEKPYNPNEKPEDQVKNNFHFGKNNRAVIKTGANMSGKTKSLKQSIWPIAFANSI